MGKKSLTTPATPVDVVYLGNFSAACNTEVHILNCLRNAGLTVLEVDEAAHAAVELVRSIARRRPKVFLFAKGRHKKDHKSRVWPENKTRLVDLLKAIRPHTKKICCWIFDLLAEEYEPTRFAWAQRLAPLCDLFCTTDGYTAPELANSYVLRQGIAPEVDRSIPYKAERDLLFLGTPYGRRQDYLALLRETFPTLDVVNNCFGAELAQLIPNYKLVVGPLTPYHPRYWSNRLYVVAGHGGCFITPTVPGMADEGWLPNVHYLPCSTDPEQAVLDVAAALKPHPDISAAARELASQFTYQARVNQLIKELGLPCSTTPT